MRTKSRNAKIKNEEVISMIIELIDILILMYKKEEIDFLFAPNKTLQAYWVGKKDALKELKNILED